jgi:L-rhamnose mutarotase
MDQEGQNMERRCFSFQIFPGKEAEYDTRHDEIWPEMLVALKQSGISNYTLFRNGLIIFGYLEVATSDVSDVVKHEIDDVQARWAESMKEIIDASTVKKDSAPQLVEVWHMD